MLCSRVTLSSRSHENFISHRNTGNRFSRRTEKISATRRNLRSVRLWLFPRRRANVVAGIGDPGEANRTRAPHQRCRLQRHAVIPSNSRCQGTSNDIARVPSAATASRVPRGAMNDGSNPSLSADLSRRRRSSSVHRTVSAVGRVPNRRRSIGHSDSGVASPIRAASRNACRRRGEKCL